MREDIWGKLQRLNRPLVLYGMGNGAEAMIRQLAKYGLAPSGFFASDDFVRGQSFLGFPVLTFSQAKERFPDMVVLVAFGTQRPEVIQNILSLEAEVYAPEVPVAGNEVFTLAYARENRKAIEAAYALLADDRSRRVFEELIAYKLDGEIRHLLACESERDELYALLSFHNRERYLDLGAYNGDTVLEFIQQNREWESITAVEPDAKNFRKLMKNTAGIENITCIQAVAGDTCGIAHFSSFGGRNSRPGNGGQVPAITVDSLKKPFSFIKMDVEGGEAAVLQGARETIRNDRPKMLVAAYHRSGDLFSLPLTVHRLNPNYKIYLRHQRYIPAWDTNYCFIER